MRRDTIDHLVTLLLDSQSISISLPRLITLLWILRILYHAPQCTINACYKLRSHTLQKLC
jgi:hypothetical protein